MSYDPANRLEHALSRAADDLDEVFDTVADEIHRHASLQTLPTHDDIARWASAIDYVTKAVRSVERAIEARNLHELPVSVRLQ